MSNRLFQGIIHQMKDAVDRIIGVIDENGVIIDEPKDIVGDALNHFGEYEEDSVFVRSDPKRCDYEILRDLRSYAEFRSTLPPKI